MKTFSIPARARAVVAAVAVALLAALAALAPGLAAPASAAAARSLVGTGTNVYGYCSQAGGFQTNVVGTASVLRVTLTPASPRAGATVRVKVFVLQSQRTPQGQYYPARLLRGQVVIAFGAKHKVLNGPVNAKRVTGVIFPKGWTATATMKAPKAGRHSLLVDRIVYNVRGGGSGGWGTPYEGFDLVCSGGLNPSTHVTPYVAPRLHVTVRKS